MTSPSERRAHVVGLGLIGGSVALALKERGWAVSGHDANAAIQASALERGVISSSDFDDNVSFALVCTPAATVASIASALLSLSRNPELVVSDVAGVKGQIVGGIEDPRFLGGHPMAGSEMRGLDGARADLFVGATWVLTPTTDTPVSTYSKVLSIVRELGASVLALEAADHDRLVAMASHVPHVVAGSLMSEAQTMAQSDRALLQLAAGGFRDMTRISAGDPSIWPDVLFENAEAVTTGISQLVERLQKMAGFIHNRSRDELLEALNFAASARRALPGRSVADSDLVDLRIPVLDRPGVLAEVATLASDLAVNIYDVEIAHGVEGSGGVLLLAVARSEVGRLASALSDRGYRATVSS